MPKMIVSIDGVVIKEVQLTKDRTTLGRRPYNDIVIDNLAVSGEHAVLQLNGNEVYLEDLNSTNGTFLNGQVIKSRQLLQDNDIINIGNFRIQYLATSKHEEEPSKHDETTAMSLDALGLPGTTGVMHASLKVLSGSSTGLEMPVVKAVTTFGQPGVAVVSISHRRDGYYVAHMDGQTPSTCNGKPIGSKAIPLAHRDVLNLAGTEMEFLLKSA
jgi:hypothetical protein